MRKGDSAKRDSECGGPLICSFRVESFNYF